MIWAGRSRPSHWSTSGWTPLRGGSSTTAVRSRENRFSSSGSACSTVAAMKPHTAVKIDQMAGAALPDDLADRLHQFWKLEKIVLKEGVRRHLPAIGWNAQHHFDPAFRRWIRPHAPDLLVDGRLRNAARVDVLHQTTVPADKSDVQLLLRFVPLATDHDPVAISIRLRTRDHRLDPIPAKSADAVEQAGNLLLLDGQLMRVGDVLVLTTAAGAEMAADGFDTVRGRRQDPQRSGSGKALFDGGDFHFDLFTVDHEGYEHDEILHPPHAFAAKGNVGNAQHQLVSDL